MSLVRSRVSLIALLVLFAWPFVHGQTIDPNFNPGANTFVYALASQPGGRILVGGVFTQLAGRSRAYLGRLNADGSLDTSFAPVVSNVVHVILVQPDARILIAGQFTTVGGQSRGRIARLNADGSLDTTFNPGTGSNGIIRSLALQSDGKIILGGSFDSVDERTRNGIARLNSDGSLDLAFNPDATGVIVPQAAPGVTCIAIQADSKIVFGGQFVFVGGQVRNGLARVNVDGSLDAAFAPSPRPQSYDAVVVLPNRQLLVAGGFTTVGGSAQPNLARLNPDGTADLSFAVAINGSVPGLFLQSDGSILISGFFSEVGGQPHARFARLNRFGVPAAGFKIDLVTSPTLVLSPVGAVLAQPDGGLIFGGDFSVAAGVPRANLARLTASGASRLANLSARGFIAAGADLTVGITARGGAKSLLLRAIGPTLGTFGVTGALADPRLEVIPAGTTTASGANDDWAGGAVLVDAFGAVGAFALPAGSKDAALVTLLTNAGATARIVSVATGGSGIALAEIYDRDPLASGARLVNLSTLGFVGAGAQALVPGFVITGGASKTLLIRAVGPTLAPFGVGDLLADPQIAVVLQGGSTVVASNDNWSGDATLAASFVEAGAFSLPANSRDAALVTQLPPGAYTVVVTGIGGATGRALVEIYDLDP
jgi:uncharacterized delta-60 repeat protein